MPAPSLRRRSLLLCPALPLAAAESLLMVCEVAPPYTLPPGDPRGAGIDVDIARAALARGGGPAPSMQFVPFRRGLAMMASGEADLMFGLRRTPERERFLHFSQPYGSEVIHRFLRRRADPVRVRSLDDLRALRVGLVSGFVYPPALLAALGPQREMATTRVALLRMAAAGRVDVAVMERLTAAWLMSEEGLAENLQAEDFSLAGGESTHMAVSRGSPRAVAALDALNRGLALLQAEGWARFEEPYL